MTANTTQGIEHSDVVLNERMPIRHEFKYSDETCGYVYAKLYNDAGVRSSKPTEDNLSILDNNRKPYACYLSISNDANQNVSDHNIVIGHIDGSFISTNGILCTENAKSIFEHNRHTPLFGFPMTTFESTIINRPITFARNLIANQTCVAPIGVDEKGHASFGDVVSAENLPMHSSVRIDENECRRKMATLYNADELTDTSIATGRIRSRNLDKKNYVLTLALDVGDSRIDGYRTHENGQLNMAGRVNDFYPDHNILITGVDRLNYNALGLPAYQEYYRSEQTDNITDYAVRTGIEEPTFVGNLVYSESCPKQYLADTQYTFDSTSYDESLPLGVSIRTTRGNCLRNLMKLYNVTNYDDTVVTASARYAGDFNLDPYEEGLPTYAILSFHRLVNLVGNVHSGPTIAETFGDFNAVKMIMPDESPYPNQHPPFVQHTTHGGDISDYTHINNYEKHFVANMMYPVTCDGTEALNDADVQEYINRVDASSTYQLVDNSECNQTTAGQVSYGLAIAGGALISSAIIGASLLAYKFIKSRLGRSSYRVAQKNAEADKSCVNEAYMPEEPDVII